MMKEMLRVALTPRQVREAVIEWARKRTLADGLDAAAIGIGEEPVEVVFTKPRAPRKPKEATP